jgi:hypothetical protein
MRGGSGRFPSGAFRRRSSSDDFSMPQFRLSVKKIRQNDYHKSGRRLPRGARELAFLAAVACERQLTPRRGRRSARDSAHFPRVFARTGEDQSPFTSIFLTGF